MAGHDKQKQKSFVIPFIWVATLLFLIIPLLLKFPAIKGFFSWWLDFTDNPEYKSTYVELIFGITGVFISVLAALRTEDYFRKKEEQENIDECFRFLHAELNRCFYKLQLIFRETKMSSHIEDTGPEFRNAFCEIAKKHRLDLNNEWISYLARLNGRISKFEWNTLQMYFSRLSVVDHALQSGDVQEISDIYVPFICYFITTGGDGIFPDVSQFMQELEKNFSNMYRGVYR